MKLPDLSPRLHMELLQCVRLGIYRAEQDAKNQSALDVRLEHQKEAERRRELLRLLGGEL